MQIIMETPVVGNKTEETRSRNVLVMVHEPGTAPLPSSAKTITLFPGNWIDVSVSKVNPISLFFLKKSKNHASNINSFTDYSTQHLSRVLDYGNVQNTKHL